MRTEYEKYRETGMLGGYDPHGALLRETESGEVLTSFRDTCYQHQGDHNINQREMLIGGKVFHVTSVFRSRWRPQRHPQTSCSRSLTQT